MNTTTNPATTRGPGGVPITVWACGRETQERSRRVGHGLARRLITELAADGAVIGVAGQEASGLALASAAKHAGHNVFPLNSEQALSRHTRQAGLVVLVPPPLGTEREAAPSVQAAHAAYQAAVQALAPGGVCAVVTRHIRRHGQLRDQAAAHVRLARAAGLVYRQHIIAVRTSLDDDSLTPPDGGWERAAHGNRRSVVSAFGVHDDVLIFTKPAAAEETTPSGETTPRAGDLEGRSPVAGGERS